MQEFMPDDACAVNRHLFRREAHIDPIRFVIVGGKKPSGAMAGCLHSWLPSKAERRSELRDLAACKSLCFNPFAVDDGRKRRPGFRNAHHGRHGQQDEHGAMLERDGCACQGTC